MTTTWAFGYFSEEERAAFVDLLRVESARRPIAWVSAEGAGTVTALGTGRLDEGEVLGALVFDGAHITTHRLARVHEHGNWIDWRA